MQQKQNANIRPMLLSLESEALGQQSQQPNWLTRFLEPQNVPFYRNIVNKQVIKDLVANPLLWFRQNLGQFSYSAGIIIDDRLFMQSQAQEVIDKLQREFEGIPIIIDTPDLSADNLYHFSQAAGVLLEFDESCYSVISVKKMMDFHSANKMLFLAYSQPLYRQLGPLIAHLKNDSSLINSQQNYRAKIVHLLRHPPSRADHTNALMHMQGYFKKTCSPVQRANLTQAILNYHAGLTPLPTVISLFRELLQTAPHPWLQQQRYLFPRLPLNPYGQKLSSGEV